MSAHTALYAPPAMYAWDFWLLEHGEQWHLFHLQAPRDEHPESRHQLASVGHAVSSDLENWEPRPTAFEAGPEGAWDDQCIWTGSMFEWQGRFWLLYTARKRGDFLLQKIGLAVSDDLEHWERHRDNPVMTADPRWYQTRPDAGPLKIEDWRDPYLCLVDGRPTALITARTAIPPGTWKLRVIGAHLKEFARMSTPLPSRVPLGQARGARLSGVRAERRHAPLAGEGAAVLHRGAMTAWSAPSTSSTRGATTSPSAR